MGDNLDLDTSLHAALTESKDTQLVVGVGTVQRTHLTISTYRCKYFVQLHSLLFFLISDLTCTYHICQHEEKVILPSTGKIQTS